MIPDMPSKVGKFPVFGHYFEATSSSWERSRLHPSLYEFNLADTIIYTWYCEVDIVYTRTRVFS